MNLKRRIEGLSELGEQLSKNSEKLGSVIDSAFQHNKWFVHENCRFALESIIEQYLNYKRLTDWANGYKLNNDSSTSMTVGIIMAGNIPLVGFHDLLVTLISGNHAQIKLSSKDEILLPYLLEKLVEIDSGWKEAYTFQVIMKNFDAIIATGSNNSARYFDYYFAKYPNITRKNRNSVAILDGDESDTDIKALGEDIFRYFGLGCRNVSKLYVPENFDLVSFLDALEPYSYVMDYKNYKDNYDYNRTVLLMNQSVHHASDFLILDEQEQLSSPIATLHYQKYTDEDHLTQMLKLEEDNIQCIVDRNGTTSGLSFGGAQKPGLGDYADNVDTMKFLLNLSQSVKNV